MDALKVIKKIFLLKFNFVDMNAEHASQEE